MIPVWHTDTSAICPSTSLCSLCEVAATGVSKCAGSSRGSLPPLALRLKGAEASSASPGPVRAETTAGSVVSSSVFE
jgi:hypothetical protein